MTTETTKATPFYLKAINILIVLSTLLFMGPGLMLTNTIEPVIFGWPFTYFCLTLGYFVVLILSTISVLKS